MPYCINAIRIAGCIIGRNVYRVAFRRSVLRSNGECYGVGEVNTLYLDEISVANFYGGIGPGAVIFTSTLLMPDEIVRDALVNATTPPAAHRTPPQPFT